MKYIHILFVLLCISCIKLEAQSIRFYTVDRELSSSRILLNYQDKAGNIWIATEDGLNRYDGAKFSIYKHSSKDKFSIIGNSIHTICEDSKDNLFIGTDGGLMLYDRAADNFIRIPIYNKEEKIQKASIRKIKVLSDGTVIVGASGFDGLYIISKKGNGFEAHAVKDINLPSNVIWNLYEDSEKNLWISVEGGGLIKARNNKIIKQYFADNGMITNPVTAMCEDADKTLYAGTMGKGILVYDKKRDVFEQLQFGGMSNLPIMTLYPAGKDEIYIGTDGFGFKVYNIKNRTIRNSNINITSFDPDKSKVMSVIKDHADNIWIGIYQKGLMMIPNITNEFKYIGSKSSEHNIIGSNSVSAIYKDRQGTLWVGTENDGLYEIADNKLKMHIESLGKSNTNQLTIVSMYEDSKNNLWAGTYLTGLLKIDKQKGSVSEIKELRDKNQNIIQKVYCFAEDKRGRLWIGTMGSGLYYMDLGSGKISNMTEGKGNTSLENGWINTLYIGNDGKLYIGTCDALECLDLNTLEYEHLGRIRKSMDHTVVYSIFEDKKENMWIGTSSGLIKVGKKQIKTFTTEDGLPSNAICRIEADRNENIWISTNYGLCKYDAARGNFLNFYTNNGLQGNEFSKNASCKDSKGNIYFGGINGITYFNPDEITTSKQHVDVFISDFYIGNRPVRKGMKSDKYDIIDNVLSEVKEINLSYKDNSFTVEFSNLEFNSNEHICYMYSINNDSWNSLQNGVNSVFFSDLPAGEYIIRYRAQNYDNYSSIRQIKVTIHPAWYRSTAAKTVYLLIIVAIIALILYSIKRHYKVQQEIMRHVHAKEINETKLQFFINISHEIRTPMSLIISPLQKLIMSDRDVERQKSYKLIYNNSKRILQLINQLMDLRKIDKGQMVMHFAQTDIIGFTKEVFGVFEYQAERKNIAFSFTHAMESLDAWIDPKNFDKIIINLVSNAFKYTAKDGRIDVSVETVDINGKQMIRLTVSDDGETIGKEDMERIFERFYQIPNSKNTQSIGTGIGLNLTRTLVELHHGTIGVMNNEDGKGCRFVVDIPAGNSHLKAEEMYEEKAESVLTEDKQLMIEAEIDDTATNEKEVSKSKSSYRVMIVEDDDEIRNYIVNELSSSYHIVECCNGKEALAAILKKRVDLVISDVMMPEMDGMTLCKKIKQNVNINDIPVILLTAKCREEDNIEGLSAGADAYITKPFSIDILHNTVDNLLKSREVLRNCFTGNQEQEERQPKFEIKSTDNKLLDRIMNVINKNIGNPELSVDMIATEVGISRVHLHRKLKELTNQTTRDLIRNVRLKQAVTLLESKQYNVSEVAMLTGFSNITIFSRAFKELYGMSPVNYMNDRAKNSSAEPAD